MAMSRKLPLRRRCRPQQRSITITTPNIKRHRHQHLLQQQQHVTLPIRGSGGVWNPGMDCPAPGAITTATPDRRSSNPRRRRRLTVTVTKLPPVPAATKYCHNNKNNKREMKQSKKKMMAKMMLLIITTVNNLPRAPKMVAAIQASILSLCSHIIQKKMMTVVAMIMNPRKQTP